MTVPVGTVLPYAGATAPDNYLLCYGQAISRNGFADLFDVIGTTYGSGDGTTTFNLPDLRGRVVAGKDNMGGTSADRLTGQTGGVDGSVLGAGGGEERQTLTELQLPHHSHTVVVAAGTDAYTPPGNVFQRAGSVSGSVSQPSDNTGNDHPHNNVQPTFILNYIIYVGEEVHAYVAENGTDFYVTEDGADNYVTE